MSKIRKFKKPNGYIVLFDPNNHKPEYLETLIEKVEEVKETPKKKVDKKKENK